MGLFDWLGPTSLTRRAADPFDSQARSGQVPAAEQKRYDFVPLNDAGTTINVTPITFSVYGGPGVTNGSGNSAVFACLQLIATALTEAPFKVYRVTEDERNELPPSPLSELLARPNPAMTFRTLLSYASDCLHVDGNAYWRKLRAGDPETGNVVELWPISPSNIEVVTRPGSTDFISFYRYSAGSGRPEEISPGNMIHFRYGLDDADHRLGCAPIRRLLREISSDEQATRYADRLLANLAINGLTLSFDKEAPPITQATADEMKARIAAAYGGENVGAVSVLSPGATLTALGFSPEQMDLRVLHQVPEERIAAALGVPAAVVGLGAGLEHSIYNNVKQAEEHFTERKLVPMWDMLAETLTLQLAVDFTSDRSIRILADTSDVRALADDQNALAERLKTLTESGILTLDEARAEIGLPPLAAPAASAPPTPAARSRPRLLRVPALTTKAIEDLPSEYDALKADQLPVWEEVAITYFVGQQRRVLRRLHRGADHAGDLVPDGEAALLADALAPLQTELLGDVTGLVVTELGVAFQLDDPATRAYLRDAGVNIVGITSTTRSAVQAALIEGQQAGEGIPDLARRLRDLPAFGSVRARVVARTELAHATNTAALASYRGSGVVVGVRVLDGDYDAACSAMNGRTFRLDQPPPTLQHPNCTRALSPIVDAAELSA